MPLSPRALSVLAVALLAACGGGDDDGGSPPPQRAARPVSILVEVYDPTTNFVWENVSVRVVEADQEWSGCTCANPVQEWYLTDAAGQVLLDEFVLARADVGFVEDGAGGAILAAHHAEDQATVVLEIDAVGFTPVIVEVPLSWSVPDVLVEVPFN